MTKPMVMLAAAFSTLPALTKNFSMKGSQWVSFSLFRK